jgi:hypothetical protein
MILISLVPLECWDVDASDPITLPVGDCGGSASPWLDSGANSTLRYRWRTSPRTVLLMFTHSEIDMMTWQASVTAVVESCVVDQPD